jgi:hypothetical protein
MIVPGSGILLPQQTFTLNGSQPIGSGGGSGGGGTGSYAPGDVLTLVGGTLGPNGAASTVTVATVSSGQVTSVTVGNSGAYAKLPALNGSAVSTTNGGQGGGTGTGATIIPNWTTTYWTNTGIPVPGGDYTLTAALDSVEGTDYAGYFTSLTPTLGAISPTTFSGFTIANLGTTNLTGIETYTTKLFLVGNVVQSIFTTLSANSISLNSASADVYVYLGGSNQTLWQWNTTRMFTTAGDIPVAIT